MANDSTAAGYLTPVGTPPAEDADLDALIQPVIVGITGLGTTVVFPKWQAVPPSQPTSSANWCAFGVVATSSDTNPTVTHNGADAGGLGTSTVSRTEFLDVTASFYGPNCRAYATLLRDGLNVTQNRDALRANGIAYVATERLTLIPELKNEQFIRRVDLVFNLRRMINRTYNIQNLVSAQGTITADVGSGAGEATLTANFNTGS